MTGSAPEASPPAKARTGGNSSWSRASSDQFAIFVLVFFSVLLYVSVVGFDFVADDRILLQNNPYLQSFHFVREIFTRDFWSFLGARGESTYYRPLVMFCLLIERQVFGPRSFGFHLSNLALNTLVVVLVFMLARRFWPSIQAKERSRGALWAALLFAALPVHTENVAPVSGLSDLLCAVFFISAVLFYSHPAVAQDERAGKLFVWTAAALFLLASLCKEVALVLPLLAVLYEHIVRGRVGATVAGALEEAGTRPTLISRARRYAPMFLVMALYLTIRLAVVGGWGQALAAHRIGNWKSLLFALCQIGSYVYKLVLPLHLTYAWKFAAPSDAWDPSVLFGGFVIVLACVAARRSWRSLPTATFAIAWFFLTLAPVLNLGGVGVVAYGERYLYIPSVPFCCLVAQGVSSLGRANNEMRPRRAKTAEAVLAVLVVLATVRTALRLPDWMNNFTLAQATLADDPNSAIYHLYLGNNYRQRGQRGLARIEYVQAIGLDPTMGEAYLDLAGVLLDDGAVGAAHEFLERAIEANPRLAEAYFELGRLELHQHHLDFAREYLNRALALNPDHFDALSLLGAMALEAGDFQQAQALLSRALATNPSSVETLVKLGVARAQSGDISGATREFRRAVALQPGSSLAHFQLGLACRAAGNLPEARRELREALRLNPAEKAIQEALRELETAAPKTTQ